MIEPHEMPEFMRELTTSEDDPAINEPTVIVLPRHEDIWIVETAAAQAPSPDLLSI